MKSISPLLAKILHDYENEKPVLAKQTTAALASEFGFFSTSPAGYYIPFLTPKQLADALVVSPKTLERMRKKGGGPPFFKAGGKNIRYPITSLDLWVRSQLTTSDLQAPPVTDLNNNDSN